MRTERQQLIRSLFDEYIEMYASRDDRLTTRFSDNFSGYTGGGNCLVTSKAEWISITRQDFAQVPGRLGIEMLDVSLQDISDDVVASTAFFHIHLPTPDHILSRETARLVLIFRLEDQDWKIIHSGISIPYHLVQDGEVYPINGLQERNAELAALVEERTRELAEANNKLEALSYTDALTGIANRRSFDRMLAQEWSRAQRASAPLSLIMLDVDHFKHFNDHYGHPAGDACLQAIAQALTQAAQRAGDLVARYGGEEFVVLLPNSNTHETRETARRIQQGIWSLALPHANIPPGIVTVSLGLASLHASRLHAAEELLHQADAALYRAKQAGRNCQQTVEPAKVGPAR
ncbi:diguanylate cyclase [Uliginosibacterium sp. 31-16]|uniref:GGDEF domain-containing protein n=1 Tax=Uliginosibacterium sp. 31-16 TaxID=3068315 RepID=UPI00273EB177|nr:diguanylate cyclase [Uliginosibacterium sp. 31-16]MDP5239319.1 diguanylate cyclase [Uliginosibacterium sp. 31-16]